MHHPSSYDGETELGESPDSTPHSPSPNVDWTSVQARIDSLAKQRESAWIAYRRERHQMPEPSGEERETSHSICQRLTQLGLTAFIPERGVGVVADLLLGGATMDDPAIALRADIDALRMPDRKPVAHASARAGLAHACGHDVHATVVLAATELLQQFQTTGLISKPLRIRLLFQAAEETGDGAAWMVEDGYIEPVRSILGLHVEPNLLVGYAGIRYGVFTAAVDAMSFTVRGRGGHTARPHTTTDPVLAATMLVSALYQLLPRSADVRDPSVFTIGQIHGGHAPNVIPDEVQVMGTLRTTDPTGREVLMKKIEAAASHIASLTGNTIDIDVFQSLGCVINSRRETQSLQSSAQEVCGANGVVIIDQPSMGGEDFAEYLPECSGSQFRLGCAKEMPWPHLHSPVFDVDERCIPLAARLMARSALRLGLE